MESAIDCDGSLEREEREKKRAPHFQAVHRHTLDFPRVCKGAASARKLIKVPPELRRALICGDQGSKGLEPPVHADCLLQLTQAQLRVLAALVQGVAEIVKAAGMDTWTGNTAHKT